MALSTTRAGDTVTRNWLSRLAGKTSIPAHGTATIGYGSIHWRRKGEGMKHIWVVEMWDSGKWNTTVGVGIDRENGREALKDWKSRCPDDKFRLVKYTREDE
jgi:hypothetical protein